MSVPNFSKEPNCIKDGGGVIILYLCKLEVELQFFITVDSVMVLYLCILPDHDVYLY